jgi:hypothetical protein
MRISVIFLIFSFVFILSCGDSKKVGSSKQNDTASQYKEGEYG